VPCGITDKSVTSIQKELGREIDVEEVKEILRHEFGVVFESEIVVAEKIAV
jgi:lipoyl(octanoyl) transferase